MTYFTGDPWVLFNYSLFFLFCFYLPFTKSTFKDNVSLDREGEGRGDESSAVLGSQHNELINKTRHSHRHSPR